MSDNPDEIRADIERTRAALSENVNELVEEANPKNIAKRKVNRVKEATVGVKDRIMGSTSDAGHSATAAVGDKASTAKAVVGDKASTAKAAVGDKASSAQSAVSGAASSVGDAVASAPQTIRRRAEGNPLAAGLIAFGAGLLVSSLLPASQKEHEAVQELKENIEPVKQQASQLAREAADSFREPLQEAAESVKSTAQDAVQNVKDESASAASDVKQDVQESGERVKATRQQ
ncbi:MAG TPA: DUF3618 domain-containing protein [Propionibacteriaceae bacterium]|nr:DUF3618 domain-containing protein [Propionibacteriaceae bacterium]